MGRRLVRAVVAASLKKGGTQCRIGAMDNSREQGRWRHGAHSYSLATKFPFSSVKDRMKQCAGVPDPLPLLASSDLNSTSKQLLQTLKEKENAIAENQRAANALEQLKHNAEVSETDEKSFACPGRCVCKDHQ